MMCTKVVRLKKGGGVLKVPTMMTVSVWVLYVSTRKRESRENKLHTFFLFSLLVKGVVQAGCVSRGG